MNSGVNWLGQNSEMPFRSDGKGVTTPDSRRPLTQQGSRKASFLFAQQAHADREQDNPGDISKNVPAGCPGRDWGIVLDALLTLNVLGMLNAGIRDWGSERARQDATAEKRAAQGLLDFEAVFLTWTESDPIMDRHEREH
jgi:hypothetical protein